MGATGFGGVGVRAGRLVLVGVVGLWFDRRFLRLRTGLRRIRWWRSSVGCRALRWRPAVVHGHDRAPVRVTAHTSDGRLAAAFGGRRRSRAGPPAGALQRGVGPGCAVWWRLLLVVAFVPDPSSLSSPDGSRPVRWRQAGSHLLGCGNARLDTTGPASLASPADSDEGSGTTPLWCERGALAPGCWTPETLGSCGLGGQESCNRW